MVKPVMVKHLGIDPLEAFAEDCNDPREYERRLLLDTYRTFGCESGTPTYRYSLIDGVNDGFLVNPLVVDARTDVTTQLLSDKGYAVIIPVEDAVRVRTGDRGQTAI